MATISVSFENRDMADIAMARLRHKGIAYKVSELSSENADTSHSPSPVAPQYYANILFPHQPINLTNASLYSAVPNVGSRVVMGADTMGIPTYGINAETHARFIVNDAYRDTVRTILRNSGGYNIK